MPLVEVSYAPIPTLDAHRAATLCGLPSVSCDGIPALLRLRGQGALDQACGIASRQEIVSPTYPGRFAVAVVVEPYANGSALALRTFRISSIARVSRAQYRDSASAMRSCSTQSVSSNIIR